MENTDLQLNPLLLHGASLSYGTQESAVSNIDVTQPYVPIEFNPQTIDCDPDDCIQE
ncbi:hypothetical protein MCL36_09040 [Acinetobacter pittii]|uniref:hypothetical protein n=1 Tax=Acinetobacter pittii TaxID=48296 RepID=UPI001EFD7C4C|nr:hypothetical protein [Acinetobacter pittii]MCG9492673.1 hypothetical protein [Acinetobacter pittii]